MLEEKVERLKMKIHNEGRRLTQINRNNDNMGNALDLSKAHLLRLR